MSKTTNSPALKHRVLLNPIDLRIMEDSSVGTFGTRVAGKNAIECTRLKELGISLYLDERKNGQLCLQIRQD